MYEPLSECKPNRVLPGACCVRYITRQCFYVWVTHCCQLSPKVPGQLEKRILQNAEQILHCHWSIFQGFGKEIFFYETKLTPQKIEFVSKLRLGKLKIVKHIFRPIFSHFWTILGVVWPLKFFGQRIFFAVLWSYFDEFSATWQQALGLGGKH